MKGERRKGNSGQGNLTDLKFFDHISSLIRITIGYHIYIAYNLSVSCAPVISIS